MGRTHALSGAVGMFAAAPLLRATVPGVAPHGPVALAAATVVAAGAALLPDLDHPSATVARSLPPVTTLLARGVAVVSGGHRKATHSIPATLAATALFGLAGSAGGWWAWVPVVLLAGLAVTGLGLTGSIAAWSATAGLVAVGVATGVDLGSWLGVAVGAGWAAHIAGDCATVHGCPLWWPRPKCWRFARLSTGGTGETVVAVALAVFLAGGAWLSWVGGVL